MRIERGGAFVKISKNGGEGRVKRCARCHVDKPLPAFTKGTGPGGLHRHCRECCAADRRRRRAESKA
jgi:hypothetical protein